MHRRRRGVERAAVSTALVAALALRLHRLAEANAWWDEALAIWAVRDSLAGVTAWTATDVHPPVFFWQLWLWVRLVGESEFTSRVVTAYTGVLLVAVAYALGRRAAGVSGGVLAAWMAAVAPLLVWWSMELRMYTTAGLFVAVATWFALAWAVGSRRRNRLLLIGYACAAWAALHTVYLAAAPVSVTALAVLAAVRHDRRRAAAFTAANACVAVLTLPWLAYAVPRMSSWSSIAAPAGIGFVARLWATLLATGRSTEIDRAAAATLVFWLAAGGALWVSAGSRAPHHRRLPRVLLGLYALTPPIVVWAITQPRSLFYAPGVEARYFVPFAVPALCFVAAALASAWAARRSFALAAALLVLGIPLAALPARFAGRHWRDAPAAMAAAIWSQARPGDVVVLVSGDRYPLFRHAYDRRPPPGTTRHSAPATTGPPAAGSFFAPPDRPPVIAMPEPGGGPLADYSWRPRMARLLQDHDRIWLAEVESHLQDPDGSLEKWLADRRDLVFSEAYGPDALHLFARDGLPPLVEGPFGASRALGLAAERPGAIGEEAEWFWLSPPSRRVLPGDQVNLALAGTTAPESALVAQTGPGYRVASARFSAPPPDPRQEGLRRYRAGLDITARVPAGSYDIRLAGDPQSIGTLAVRGSAPPLPLEATDITLTGPAIALEARAGADAPSPATGVPVATSSAPPGRAVAHLMAVGWTAEARPGGLLVLDLVWAPLTGTPTVAGGAAPRPATDTADTPPGSPAAGEPPTVFVHLLGPPRDDGSIVWAGDDAPVSGGWPPAAEGVLDRHLLELPAELPSGAYSLEFGLYEPRTLQRYSVAPGTPAGPVRVDASARRMVVDSVHVRPAAALSRLRDRLFPP